MKHQDIINALNTLTPGAKWNLNGDTTAGLIWLDTTQIQPTDAAITVAIAAYVAPIDPVTALQTQVAALQTQIATLVAAQGK